MEISHMTLLIVTLAFSLVNICLIIATGGIIYNWQDRFMGPVLKCDQPKWNSNNNNWNTWGNWGSWGGVNNFFNNAGNWVSGVVNNNNNNNNGNGYAYGNTGYGAGYGAGYGNAGASQWIVGNMQNTGDNNNKVCPVLVYPRWNNWNTNTNWGSWGGVVGSWNVQPSVSWTVQPVAVTWTAQPVYTSWAPSNAWANTVLAGSNMPSWTGSVTFGGKK